MIVKLLKITFFYISGLYLALLFLVSSLAFFPVAFFLRYVTCWFDRRLVILNVFTSFWASCYTWLSPLWSVVITGREHVDRRRVYVFVCNHQSMLDIPVIFRTFLNFKWVAKSSLFKIPVIGWNMWLNRSIKIERSSVTSQRKMLARCVKNIQNGSSIMIFPEGTRSGSSEMRAFKEGAFLIALQEKTDIVPIALDGSYKAFNGSKQKIYLNILQPITYETFKDMTVRQLTCYVRSVIEDELVKIREKCNNNK